MSGERMRCFVTGGAGFIGSHLVDRLLSDGHDVVVYDKLTRGRRLLEEAGRSPNVIWQGDVLDAAMVMSAMTGCDIVFHLAARADVRFGADRPAEVYEQNVQGTFNVLDAARQHKIQRVVFASSGSVYGEPEVFPTPEDAPMPVQTSIYGASKVAGEALLQSFAEAFGMQVFVFRFVSNVGERYTHGHVFDFFKKLKADASKLNVLGNGMQRKSYVYVGDTVDAIMTAVQAGLTAKVNTFNLGTDEYCTVRQSLGWICEEMGVRPELTYAGGERGWTGDSPFIFLDCRRLRGLGWAPKLTIEQGIKRTVQYMEANPWLLTRGEQ